MRDEDYMEAYQAGDESAFEHIFNKYSGKVYAYAKRRLRPDEVDDFFQDFWNHFHQKRSSYRSQPFALWFFVLLKNLLIDEYRSRARKKKLKEEYISQTQISPSDSEVEEVLKHLPKSSESLVRKLYLEGFTYEDLEKELGLSQITLRKRLSRAMAQLRKMGGAS